MNDTLGAYARLTTQGGDVGYYSLKILEARGVGSPSQLPYSVRVLLEALLRKCDGKVVTERDVAALARWGEADAGVGEIAFFPSRVLLQDFTGVPAGVDLAALREATHRLGGGSYTDQSSHPRGSRDRPLGAGRLVRHGGFLGLQREPRV